MPDSAARDTVLARVRAALGDLDQTAAGEPGRPAQLAPVVENAASRPEILARFEERLHDYDAEVEHAGRDHIAEAVAQIVDARGLRRIVVPPGLDPAWTQHSAGIEVDRGFSAQELDTFDGVITGATLGIAETGTLVLQTTEGQGRRALSLVPDNHLCVIRADDIVASVPEAIARLQSTAHLPTTFISGPSATADIEMTRIKGVHGPRFLHVVVVTE